jgi:hypothetical protein
LILSCKRPSGCYRQVGREVLAGTRRVHHAATPTRGRGLEAGQHLDADQRPRALRRIGVVDIAERLAVTHRLLQPDELAGVDGAAIGGLGGHELDLGCAIVGELRTQQPLQARSDVCGP